MLIFTNNTKILAKKIEQKKIVKIDGRETESLEEDIEHQIICNRFTEIFRAGSIRI